MKKRNMSSFSENRIQNMDRIKGGYPLHRMHWWPKHLQKYQLHVLEKFNLEKC
jgi:hypothetical protein